MATEEQKKLRQLRLFNGILFGFGKGLYEIFEDSALATVDTIGEDILEEMEQHLGLEVHGETPADILTEIERLLVDEYGLFKDGKIEFDGDQIKLEVDNCIFHKSCQDLTAAGVPSYTCVPMMMASAALRKRLGKHARFLAIEQNHDERQCFVEFKILG